MLVHNGLSRIKFIFARSTHIQKRWLSVVLEPLEERSILSVRGSDAMAFLQGLVTNDMNHFTRGSASIYTMFLNTSGRVLYDSLIYHVPEDAGEHFLLECDTSIVDQLMKHLNLFRVRKKVDISKPDRNVFAAFVTEHGALAQSSAIAITKTDNTLIFKDARLQELGYRLLASSDTDLNCLKSLFPNGTSFDRSSSYEQRRYELGIGEGVRNLPLGKCFPLENNCDYLHGVSFHKGCYIGQELTARTHHTGVVRKRLMPLIFDQPVLDGQIAHDAEIKTKEGQIIGKLRGYHAAVGLGLVRVEKVGSNPLLIVDDKYHCRTYKPNWWPAEQPKNI